MLQCTYVASTQKNVVRGTRPAVLRLSFGMCTQVSELWVGVRLPAKTPVSPSLSMAGQQWACSKCYTLFRPHWCVCVCAMPTPNCSCIAFNKLVNQPYTIRKEVTSIHMHKHTPVSKQQCLFICSQSLCSWRLLIMLESYCLENEITWK